MLEKKLRLLFRKQKDRRTSASDSCPGDDQIARLLDPDLPAADRATLNAHIADCSYCVSRLADALKPPATGTTSVPHAAHDRLGPRLPYIGVAAAAAVVATALFWLQPGDGITPGVNADLRAIRQHQAVPSLIFPTEGQVVSSTDMTVRWTPVADAMHYSVRIVDDYGRIVVDAFADAAEYAVPSHIRLAPGVNYYVKIDAYVSGDKAMSSSHINFTVTD